MSFFPLYQQPIDKQIRQCSRAEVLTIQCLKIPKQLFINQKHQFKLRDDQLVHLKQPSNLANRYFQISQLHKINSRNVSDPFFILVNQIRKKQLRTPLQEDAIIFEDSDCLKFIIVSKIQQASQRGYFSQLYKACHGGLEPLKKSYRNLLSSSQMGIGIFLRFLPDSQQDRYYLLRVDTKSHAIQDQMEVDRAEELQLSGVEAQRIKGYAFFLRFLGPDGSIETPIPSFQKLNVAILQKIQKLLLILDEQFVKQENQLGQNYVRTIQGLATIYPDQNDLQKSTLFKICFKKDIYPQLRKKILGQVLHVKNNSQSILEEIKDLKAEDLSIKWQQEANENQFLKKSNCLWNLKVDYCSYLNEVSQLLKKGHLGSLKDCWSYGLLDMLLFFKQNWQITKGQISQELQAVIRLMDYKIARFRLNLDYEKEKMGQNIQFSRKKSHYSLFQKLYPGSQQLVSSYLKLLQIKSFNEAYQQYKRALFANQSLNRLGYLQRFISDFNKLYGIAQNYVDELISKYAIERLLQNISPQPKQLWLKRQGISKPLFKCISQQVEFSNRTSQFQDILALIDGLIEQYVIKTYQAQTRQGKENQKYQLRLKNIEIEQNYLNSIEFQKMTDLKCLGCSPFFYFKTNIQDFTINQVPIQVFPSIKRIKDYQSLLKDQICAKLNSGGGVILFACEVKYKEIKVIGEKMTERNKQDSEQTVQHMVRCFYPRIQYNNQIQLTFVPVVQNPYSDQTPCEIETYKGQEGIVKANQCFLRRNYMKGVYVARIRVNPTQNHLTYVWESKDANDTRLYSAISQQGKTVQLKGKQWIKVLKRTFKRKYIPHSQILNPFELEMMKQSWSCFRKPCPLPQGGYKISEIDSNHEVIATKKEDLFNYMSLLIVKEKYLKEVQKKMKAKNIDFFIEQKFKSYKFHSAKGTYVLYHNISFDELLKAVSYDQGFRFEGKITIVIYISEYLKFGVRDSNFVTCPLNDQERINAIKWLQIQFPNETIKFYQYKCRTGFQYYASTESRMSTLYMYYLFNELGKKTLLKSPQHFSELSAEERNLLWRQIPTFNNFQPIEI